MRFRNALCTSTALAVFAACSDEEPPPPPPPAVATTTAEAPMIPRPASELTDSTSAEFGTITLSPGFSPDPHVVPGTSGGSVAASSLDGACAGYVRNRPGHQLVVSRDIQTLRILVNGPGDTTLVVRRADGSYLCNDDGEGTNPIVEAPFPAGIYEIHVGSYSESTNIRYHLGFTELPTVTAAQLSTPAPEGGTMASNFGTVSLSPGFMPDPHVVTGRSGGGVAASTFQSGCAGWVEPTPDHILVTHGAFSALRILVRSRSDTTLVVQEPGGAYRCDDDTEDRNPVVEGSFPPGAYRIWIGSFTEGRGADYRIGFSEVGTTTTRDLH